MVYIISSEKVKNSITTTDPLKDEAWGNEYFNTDDCVRVEAPNPPPLTPEQEAAQQAKSQAYAEIARLEAKQARAVREHALGVVGAMSRLEEIDSQIAIQRTIINGG